MLTDIKGTIIDIGDVVVFTEPGSGRSLPGLKFGEVIGLTKAGVRVQYLDNSYRRTMREEMVEDRTQPPRWTDRHGNDHYPYVKSGKWVENSPENVRYYADRFLIVGKV